MPYLQKRARTNSSFFFFNDTATTEIYTLSLHDALPISFYRAAEKEIGDIQAGNEQEQRNRSRQNKQCCTQIPPGHPCELFAQVADDWFYLPNPISCGRLPNDALMESDQLLLGVGHTYARFKAPKNADYGIVRLL